jgi:hypothetical protein
MARKRLYHTKKEKAQASAEQQRRFVKEMEEAGYIRKLIWLDEASAKILYKTMEKEGLGVSETVNFLLHG